MGMWFIALQRRNWVLFHSRNIVTRLGLLFDLLSRLASVRNDVWNWRAMCLWRHPSYKCEFPHLVWYPPAGGTLECFPNLVLGGRDVSPKQYLLIRLYKLVSVTLFADNIHGLWLGSGTVRPGRPQTLGRVLTATECGVAPLDQADLKHWVGYWQLLNAEWHG